VKPTISVLGMNIAKRIFHVVGMNERGQIVLRKRLARNALMPFIATLPPVLIGMEACGGAHDWARRFRAHHHDVKLMAPQFVKPSIPTVCLDIISLVASSCGYNRGEIAQRVAH
jgi:transposase